MSAPSNVRGIPTASSHATVIRRCNSEAPLLLDRTYCSPVRLFVSVTRALNVKEDYGILLASSSKACPVYSMVGLCSSELFSEALYQSQG